MKCLFLNKLKDDLEFLSWKKSRKVWFAYSIAAKKGISGSPGD